MGTYIKSQCGNDCAENIICCPCNQSISEILGATSLNVSVTDSTFAPSGLITLGTATGVFDLVNNVVDWDGYLNNPPCGSVMSNNLSAEIRTYSSVTYNDPPNGLWVMDVWVTNNIYPSFDLFGEGICQFTINQVGYAYITLNGDVVHSGYFTENPTANNIVPVDSPLYGSHFITSYGSFLEMTPFVGIWQTLTIS